MGVLGPTGNKGNPYDGHSVGGDDDHVVGGSGPTGPTGPIGSTGPRGAIGNSGGTGIGFGYCGSFSVFPGGQTFEGHDGITGDYKYYQYIAVTGATAINNTLAFYLAANLRPGSDDLQTPSFSYVPDLNNPAVDSGVQASIIGARGETGTTGPIKIVTLGSGESIVSHITTHATGQHVYFKKFDNAGSDVEFGAGNPGITLGTLFIAGVSANAADAIDMGLTGELLYITSDGFADGATGTFFRYLDSRLVSGTSSVGVSYGDTLTAKLTNHKEVIRRHGNQRGATAFPVGWSSPDFIDTDLNLGDGNIQKIYCGPTSGYINLPTPGVGEGADDASLSGNTYDHIIPFTVILHNATSHGLYTGQVGPEANPVGHPEGPLLPWELFRGLKDDDVEIRWADKSSVYFSDRIDIFNFIYSPRTTNGTEDAGKKIWYALTPSSNFGITFEGLEYERGSCCSTTYEGGCSDYITREECSNIEDSSFQPAQLCDDVNCESSISEGACCTMHTCLQSTRLECETFQGFFVPDALCGTFDCNDFPCEEPIPPVGPCCIPSQDNGGNSCYECIQVDSVVCDCLDGTFAGLGGLCSDCEAIEDPQLPVCPDEGACCINAHGGGSPGCIPPGCYNTTTSFCDTQSGIFYNNKPCCVTEEPTEGRWLTCWLNEEGERNCVLADTREESRADLPGSLPEGCSQTILWTCGPGESWPECQVACYSQYGDALGDHAPSCFQQICAAPQGSPSCPYTEQYPCEIPPGGLGCCCIDGIKHPFYTSDFCDLVGGDYTTGDCADVTCFNEDDGAGAGGPAPGCIDCQPRGACCIAGTCDDNDSYGYTQAECADSGGIYQGAYSNCEDASIECCDYLVGSCCIQGICNDGFTPTDCANAQGTFQGIGTDCSSDSIFCCEDDDSKNPDRGACCCPSDTPGCDCAFITYAQCVQRTGFGCGNCEWYQNQGCATVNDPNCTGDDTGGGGEPNEPTCPGGWHLFIDVEDSTYFGSELTETGPSELPWRTVSLNDGESKDDHTYRIYVPSGSDGYWNTHGVWRVPSRLRSEVDPVFDSDPNDPLDGETFHSGMCGSRRVGNGRRSQRLFHKDGPFNLVNHQWRSTCKRAIETSVGTRAINEYELTLSEGPYESHSALTGMWLTRDGSYGKTEFSPDGKVLTPGFGTGFAYWPAASDAGSWDIFNVAAMSYDSTGGYSQGVCQTLHAGNDHRGVAGDSSGNLSTTDKSLNNLCNIEPYIMSIDELGFVHKQQTTGNISAGLQGIYWSSSVPTGMFWEQDTAFTYNTSGPIIDIEDTFTPHKFRFAVRWMDMLGQNGNNIIPLIPGESLEMGATYRIGEDNQSQGHGRDMVYVGRFCPGITSVYSNEQGTDHQGGQCETTIVSEPLRRGKCCTGFNNNMNWPFTHNIYTCLAESLNPPVGGSGTNNTGWPIVNPLDGYKEIGQRYEGESVFSWTHEIGEEPAWIAWQTERQRWKCTLPGADDDFDLTDDQWQLAGYIEHDSTGQPHGNQLIGAIQSENLNIGCMGMYGMCREIDATLSSVNSYLEGQPGQPVPECNFIENLENITDDNYFYGGFHISHIEVDNQCPSGQQDLFHRHAPIGCQTQGRCCWQNPVDPALSNCYSACQGNEYDNQGNYIGGPSNGAIHKGRGAVYTQKSICIQTGGVWTPCERIWNSSEMPECQRPEYSDFFTRTGNCPGQVLTGACCVPGTPQPECVVGIYSDPNSGQGTPCPGTYYGDGSTVCTNPTCGTEETPCDEQSDCEIGEYCCDNNGDGNSYCQGSQCSGGGDYDDDNCCDDNGDDINDYWCLDCPPDPDGILRTCPGASDTSLNADFNSILYGGCGGLISASEYDQRRTAQFGRSLVNDPSTVRLGLSRNTSSFPGSDTVWGGFIIKPRNPAWVAEERSDRICRPMYAGEDPTDATNWKSPGCPCEPYLTQQDCYLTEGANCSPGCCHWDTDVVRDSDDVEEHSLLAQCFDAGPDWAERGCSSNPNLRGAGTTGFRTQNWMEPKFFNRHDFGRGFQWGSEDNDCYYGGGASVGCLFNNKFMRKNYGIVNYPMSLIIPSNNWSGTVESTSTSSASVYGRSGYPRTVGKDPANHTELQQLVQPSEIRNAFVDVGEGFGGNGNGPNQRDAIDEYTKRLPGKVEKQGSQGPANIITSGRGLYGWDPIDNLHYSSWIHSANIRTYGVNVNVTNTRWGNLQLGDAGNVEGSGVGGWYYLGSGYGEPDVAANNHFRWRFGSQGDQPEGDGNAWWKVGNETRFVYGKSVNGPSYWCPPYMGLQLPPSNSESWWTGSTDADGNYIPNTLGVNNSELIQAYGFDLPDQSTEDYPQGMSPCYARRFKINFESYQIDDRFQAIQLPWPKGARSTIQAYDRIRCYYNCLQEGLCLDPAEDIFQSDEIRRALANLPEAFNGGGPENRHLWLNGTRVLRDNPDEPAEITGLQTSTCAEKCLGYPASPEWVLYDSLCIHTPTNQGGACQDCDEFDSVIHEFNGSFKHGTQVPPTGEDDQPGFVQKCVHYTYPQCPLRLDYEQINNGFNYGINGYDGASTPGANMGTIEKRLAEGYGPAGHGPIPPMMVGFANCSEAEVAGGSVYKMSMSECGGWFNSVRGSNNRSVAILPGTPPEVCDGGAGDAGGGGDGPVMQDGTGGGFVPQPEDPNCGNSVSCAGSSIDALGNIRGQCYCDQCNATENGQSVYASKVECACRWKCINLGCSSQECQDCIDAGLTSQNAEWYDGATCIDTCPGDEEYMCYSGCNQPGGFDPVQSCYWVLPGVETMSPHEDGSGLLSDCHKVYTPRESIYEGTDSSTFPIGSQFIAGQYMDAMYSPKAGGKTECKSCITCMGSQSGCWPGPIDEGHMGSGWGYLLENNPWHWDATNDNVPEDSIWHSASTFSVDNINRNYECLPTGIDVLGLQTGNVGPAPAIAKSSDLVGLLCGWNSPTHETAKLNDEDTSAKVVLDQTSCPMLFLGIHGSKQDQEECESYFGSWRCLCAQDNAGLAGSSLAWSGTGAGESAPCNSDPSATIFGCPRNLSFKRLLMQYGKAPGYGSPMFTLEECSQGKYDSFYITDQDQIGAESRGFRDAPRTYTNDNGIDPKNEFLLWPWLKSNSVDGMGSGLDISEDIGLLNDALQLLPHQYLNGVPHTDNVSLTTLELGEGCVGSGFGDPEQTGICLRMQKRAPGTPNEVCCSEDPDYCENGRVGC